MRGVRGRAWPGMVAAAALMIGACGSGGSSTTTADHLTPILGASATTIAQLESGSQSVIAGLQTGSAHDLNTLTSSVAGGQLDTVRAMKIAAVLRNPNPPFEAARSLAQRVALMVSALRGAVVPPSAYTHDSATVSYTHLTLPTN